jgi:two-component system, NarL family, response regulator LiaR
MSPASWTRDPGRDAAAGTARLSPELLTRLTQALRRPPPPDPLRPPSPRERDVLRLIAQGRGNRQIAAAGHRPPGRGAATGG